MSKGSTASRLDALAGLEGAKRVIRRLATGEAGAHAVLLYGARGSGKEELAQALAEAWLCRSPGPEGADGTCQACGAFARGTNPDLLELRPSGPSRILKQGAITGDPPDDENPTALIPFFRTMPLYSRHRVAILHEADRMMGAASNALLKTLEEPHPHAKLILVTDSVGGILPTVLSRCLAVACALPEPEAVRALFPNANDDDLALAEGAPGRLRTMLEKPERYRRVADLARKLPSLPPGAALATADEMRAIAEGIDSALGCGARAANAEALALLATVLARDPQADPRWPQLVVEAHRLVQGNVNAGFAFDALFATILRKK